MSGTHLKIRDIKILHNAIINSKSRWREGGSLVNKLVQLITMHRLGLPDQGGAITGAGVYRDNCGFTKQL